MRTYHRELHMHREGGIWDDFVMVWTDFEWASFASYDYTYSFAKLTNVTESSNLFTGHVDVTLNRDVAMSGALLSYDFSFSLDADKSDGPTSCVHTACDPCKDAGKTFGCPRSCSCLPQEGVPPSGIPGSFCGPCSPGTTMVVVGNFSGTYDDCDTSIKCPRGRNDLKFTGNHLHLEGNVTLAPNFRLFKPLWPSRSSDVMPAMQNEHPRLLFRKQHIPHLQTAATTAVGSVYRERLDQSLRTNFSVWQPAGYCLGASHAPYDRLGRSWCLHNRRWPGARVRQHRCASSPTEPTYGPRARFFRSRRSCLVDRSLVDQHHDS